MDLFTLESIIIKERIKARNEGKRDDGVNGELFEGMTKKRYGLTGGHFCSPAKREDCYIFVKYPDGKKKRVTFNLKSGNGEMWKILPDGTDDKSQSNMHKNPFVIYTPVQRIDLITEEELFENSFVIPSTDFIDFALNTKGISKVNRTVNPTKRNLNIKYYVENENGTLPKSVRKTFEFLSHYPTLKEIGNTSKDLHIFVCKAFNIPYIED